ncbi:polysaccharide biosynthesis/export family protein [Gluconacetobacter sacchari]|uniref:Polysaccharide export protein n=2 Tax=Gluconacetobacter sacchari TaxID=92759 RepID=A0A7W4NML4_9PROT|nr:polysaccharide biosynthesis/export family protein [Gluconacetobacter sacchari]MBB2160557.1 polysaccharide export protein [Gluconacetobacter sacchari]GBQ33051.1 polysaccharide export protein AceH [Gluconacetobacter sacchari DSM 12717]
MSPIRRALDIRTARFCLPLMLAGAWLAGCAPGSDLSPVPHYDPSRYTIGVGDRINVATFGENQFQTDTHVPVDGNIAFPLIGVVKAQGLTTDQLSQTVAAALKQQHILSDARVTVQVLEYRPVSVIGEVEHGGQFPYQPGMTMLQAVAAAGGFSYRAFQNYAYVVRQEPGGAVVGRIDPQDYVKPNDVIKVYERHF